MSKKIKIGIVLNDLPGYSETFFHSKINGLIDNGFKVSLFVSSTKNPNLIDKRVPIYSPIKNYNIFFSFFILVGLFLFRPFVSIKFLYLEKLSNRTIIVALKNLIINYYIIGKSLDWIHFGYSTCALGKENLARSMCAKSAVSLRGYDIGIYPYINKGCYDLLWERIDKVHTISDDLYNKAIKFGLNPKIPFQKITPAINTDLFNNESLQQIHNPIRILTVGRLNWKKGYEYALKALSLLNKKQIQFEYRIIGEGDYREAIVYAIHQFGLEGHIKILGKLSHSQVKEQMKWADIYIQPSIQEGFCNSVLEAQAMGLLAIVTDAEGLSENVINEVTGWVVQKRSGKEIFDILIHIILDNEDYRNNIRTNAVKNVKENYKLENQIKKIVKFYN